jgi:hypothetical protein
MCWSAFWAILSQTHLVTMVPKELDADKVNYSTYNKKVLRNNPDMKLSTQPFKPRYSITFRRSEG